MNRTNDDLINEIRDKSSSYIISRSRSAEALNAMKHADRALFVGVRDDAYEDYPLPIGCGQTCSQPSMVAFMLDLLEIKQGCRILEIGAGCGYAAACASLMAGSGGKIYACEIIENLFEMLKNNTRKYANITCVNMDGSEGVPQFAPYDRIFLSAGIGEFAFNETAFLHQLNDGGILLYPEVSGFMHRIKKINGKAERESFYGVSFVPLVKHRKN